MPALMIQGCGSDVGKSVLVAGLCRILSNRGFTVRPFKPQNMSNNAAVTVDGGEIGRAQALQAIACRTPATCDMNPVLLKPQSDRGAQLVVLGKMAGSWQARGYQEAKAGLLDTVLQSFQRLSDQADIVIVEGAGSPAEVNLRKGDIANMGFARAAKVPVVLVGDIDRGHVIAALVGAHVVLDDDDRAMVQGFIINKFRGDPTLFDEGRAEIVRRTGWADFGMVPWLAATRRLPAEDAVVLERAAQGGGARIKIAVPMLSRIANFDDFDALAHEPAVELTFVPPGRLLPRDADLVILPGTKSTLADLAFLRAQGWDIDIAAHVRQGGKVIGICGGYQMLGRRIADPQGVEGPAGEAAGLALLDVETELTGEKVLRPASGSWNGARVTGYEIHVGRTMGPSTTRPMLTLDGSGPEGAVSDDGLVSGCYVHGLFDQAEARTAFLRALGATSDAQDRSAAIDAALDELAASLEACLDVDGLLRLAGVRRRFGPLGETRARP